MRHHHYNPDFPFVKEPEVFDKYSDKDILQYCLGATMYMPGSQNFAQAIVDRRYAGLTSMVMCFEDACSEKDLPAAEKNALHFLDSLLAHLEKGTLAYRDIPLIFFRVRHYQQFVHFSQMLRQEQLKLICGFNFPDFSSSNGRDYFAYLAQLNEQFGEILYGMPIIEDRRVAMQETRMGELLDIKAILDDYKDLVLNIRVGGTDFSASFGVRRGIEYTIYDIMTVRDCLSAILNVFNRDNDYVVSGPVWEYFRASKEMRFHELPDFEFHNSLIKRHPIVDDAVDGLMRELILDKANGFIGKTIIHPSHLNYVNAMMAVTKEEYEDALQIMETGDGVIKSQSSNKMNEIRPHAQWARKVLLRARAYGVLENQSSYLKLVR